MDVAIYMRVSTEDQNTANQLPEIERLCAARGWTVKNRYEEKVSGTARERNELSRMVAAAHRGEFKAVVVWSLDRLGRGGVAEVAGLVAKLDATGVKLVSVREPWCDTSGPVRDLLIAVMSWVAAWEKARLIERTKAGLDRARKEGVKLGRPTVHPELIEEALARVSGGESVASAARWAKIHPVTLRRYRDGKAA